MKDQKYSNSQTINIKQMEDHKLENINKHNFWQLIHDNQRGQYYRTRPTLLDEFYLIKKNNTAVLPQQPGFPTSCSICHQKHPKHQCNPKTT